MIKNLRDNKVEYYLAAVLFILLPLTVGLLTDILWGVLLSLVIQSAIGILYIIRKEN